MTKESMAVLGGRARMAKLTAKEREALALRGARGRWKKPLRLPQHQMITLMLERIESTGCAQTLFIENGAMRFCDTGSRDEAIWLRNSAHACVGTYGSGASFSDVTNDLMAM